MPRRPLVLAFAILALASVPARPQEERPIQPSELGIELAPAFDARALESPTAPRLYITRGGLTLGWQVAEPRLLQLRDAEEIARWLQRAPAEASIALSIDAQARWEAARPVVQAAHPRTTFLIGRWHDGTLAVAAEVPGRSPAAGPEVRVLLRTVGGVGTVGAIGQRERDDLHALVDDLATVQEVLPGAVLVLEADGSVPARDALLVLRGAVAAGFATLRLVAGGTPAAAAPTGSQAPDPLPADAAIERGLGWLARHQDKDGSWSPASLAARCTGDPCRGGGDDSYRTGVTALAILAFLGAGYTHDSDAAADGVAFGPVIERGLAWLIARQDPDGRIGEPDLMKPLYPHSLAALALAEAYGIMASPLYQDAARRAVEVLLRAQNPGAGWRYTPRCGESDMSVTGWCVLALQSARLAGLAVPDDAFRDALAFVNRTTDPVTGRVGYMRAADALAKVVVLGKNEEFAHHPTTTAAGIAVRLLCGLAPGDSVLQQGAIYLDADLPAWSADHRSADFYYWYWGSLALTLYADSAAGQRFAPRWNARLISLLRERQAQGGCDRGSWAPVDRWSFEGGRVYTTALGVLALETVQRRETAHGMRK